MERSYYIYESKNNKFRINITKTHKTRKLSEVDVLTGYESRLAAELDIERYKKHVEPNPELKKRGLHHSSFEKCTVLLASLSLLIELRL